MIKPICNVDFFQPDKENPHIVFVTTAKPLAKIKETVQNLLSREVPGINTFEPSGNYSFVITIARTYNIDNILDALRDGLERCQSDIITPNKAILTP